MSTFFNYILMILSEGADFVVSTITYYTQIIGSVVYWIAEGIGLGATASSLPLFTLVPVAIVIIVIKYVLNRGKS